MSFIPAILFVEELQSSVCEIARVFDESEAYLIFAFSESEAVNTAREKKPDIVVINSEYQKDLQRLIEDIRTSSGREYIPCIIICPYERRLKELSKNNDLQDVDFFSSSPEEPAFKRRINIFIKLAERIKNLENQNANLEKYALKLEGENSVLLSESENYKLITERLKKNENEYKKLAEYSPEIILKIDIYEKVSMINSKVSSYFDISPDEAASKHFSELKFPSELIRKLNIACKRVIIYKQTEKFFTYSLTKKGECFFEIEAIPLPGTGAMMAGILCFIKDLTDIKILEDESRQAKAELERVIYSIPDCIWKMKMDNSGNILDMYFSPVIQKITGYTVEEFLEKPFFLYEIVHPADKEKIEILQNTIQETTTFFEEIEFRIILSDDTIRWIKDSAYIERDSSGHISVYGIITDITQRKWVQETLRVKEEYYRTLIENTGDIIAILNDDLCFTYISPSMENILGYKSEEIISTSIEQILYPQDTENFKKKWEKLRDDVSYSGVWEFRLKDSKGRIRNIETAARNLTGNTVINGILMNFRDITPRKKAEESLKIFQMAVDKANEGIAILNEEERFIYVNNAHAKIYGYTSPGELVSKKWHILYTQDELKRFEKEIIPLFYSRGNWKGEAAGKKKSGEIFDQEISLSLLPGNFFVCIVNDISERKFTENRLQNYLEELKELNITKDKFFSIISHDLRSPLSGFLMYCEQLTRNFKMLSLQEIKSISSDMYHSAELLLKLLNNLVDWSKSQRGIIEFEPDIYNISSLIDSLVVLQLPAAEKKNIEIVIDTPEILELQFDYKMLDTVLRNLISNAVKFTPKGGRVNVKVEEKDSEYMICVSDNGRGMDEKEMQGLFKLGETQSSPGTDDEQGSGLGLILCKEFIDKHKGSISVSSEKNKGSVFRVHLPKNS